MQSKPERAYVPHPIDTSDVKLSKDILDLCEQLAENTHNRWAAQRISEQWKWGPRRDDKKKEHPMLVPYEELPESEKEYDRITSQENIKVLLTLGYTIKKEGKE